MFNHDSPDNIWHHWWPIAHELKQAGLVLLEWLGSFHGGWVQKVGDAYPQWCRSWAKLHPKSWALFRSRAPPLRRLKWTVFCPWMHGFSGCGSKMGCRWTHKSDLCAQIMTPIHKSSKPPQRHSRLPQRDHAANPWLNKSLHQNYCPALILQTCISRQNQLRWRTRTVPYKK